MATPVAPTATPCGAKTRSGGKCKAPAMRNGRCRLHGGKSLAGPASGTFKTGRYSKYMPARLLERYEAAIEDPELLNLKHDISLVDSRLSDLLQRVDTGESRTLWEKARKVNQEIQKAVHDENYGRMMVQCLELDRLIGDAMVDHEAWYEIHAILDQRRKLVESEQKRLVSMQQMITSEQAMTLITAVIDTVRRNVPDRSILAAISADITRIITQDVR